MREELRIYYRMLRKTFGAYALVLSVTMLGVLPKLVMTSVTWGIDMLLTVFSLVFALALLAKPLTPAWVSNPYKPSTGLGVICAVGLGFGALLMHSHTIASEQYIAPAASQKMFLLMMLPGAAMTLLMCCVVSVLTVLNCQTVRSYYNPNKTARDAPPDLSETEYAHS